MSMHLAQIIGVDSQVPHDLRPGQPFIPKITAWEPTAIIKFAASALYIVDFMSDLCYDKVLAYKEMPTELALADLNNVRFLLYRLPRRSWTDVPMSMSLFAEHDNPLMIEENSVIPVNLLIVDATDGLIRCVLNGELSPKFGRTLLQFSHDAVRRGHTHPQAFQGELESIYERFPNPDDMAPHFVERITLDPQRAKRQNKEPQATGSVS